MLQLHTTLIENIRHTRKETKLKGGWKQFLEGHILKITDATSLRCHVAVNPFHAAQYTRISPWENPNLQNDVGEDRAKKGLPLQPQPKSLSYSSSICGAGGNPAYRTSAFEAVCTLTPVLVPRSSPEALHARRRERPLLAKGGIMGEKLPVKFSQTIWIPRSCWVLLHVAKLRHGTDGFTSPPKEDML
jgi:hypothetical protein